MLSACIVFCVSFSLIHTVPITYNDPFFPNYDNYDYNEIVRAARNLMPKSGPESLLLKSLGVNSNLDDASEYRESNDLKRLPTLPYGDLVLQDPLPRSSYFDHGIQETLPLEYITYSKYLQSPYETGQSHLDTYEPDQAPNTGAMNVELDPYEVDLYPFVHDSISSALNTVPPVNFLPPAHGTHVHETLPSLETRDTCDYEIDVLNPENSELMPENLRITRSRREDLLDQLTHEAMMNNILPTMPIPFVRGAETIPAYQVPEPSQTSSVRAVYPMSSSNGCAVPILLGCSPNILRGTMPGAYTEHVPQGSSMAAYREAEQINRN